MTMKFGQAEEQGKPFVKVYDSIYLPDAFNLDQIKDIESKVEGSELVPAAVGGFNRSGVDKETRRSKIAWVDPSKMSEEFRKYIEAMFLSVNEQHFRFHLTGTEAFQFTTYYAENAGEYRWHSDTAEIEKGFIRKLSVSILLSDPSEFEGGKLILSPDGFPLVAEERKGRAVFFPSWVPHCVTPVTRGVRKSLVIWSHGPMFK
jgi:PKHD-type hydroxylase